MKAVYLDKATGFEGLMVGELPLPVCASGEVLIKVHATAVTPTEFQWFPTFHLQNGEPRPFPIVPSHEFSGVIAAIVGDVGDFEIGDAVYGMNDWFVNGALAEFCVAPATAVAPKPNSLDYPHAATVPISALTAWQGVFDRGELKAGQRVLIHGGAGGVGVFAVQLAHWRGAHIIATASAGNADFVRELGAAEVIDYKAERFEERVRDLDLVFDGVGGETLNRSWGLLKPNGKAVTIASQSEAATDERTRAAFFIVEPNRAQLSEIAQLLDAGTIRSFVEAVLPLDAARDAYARAQRGGMRGKVVLQVASGS
ncbi:NADP-dependent oxidoreductase [Verrucomicrobiota bacterium sgz303538]